MESQWIDDFLTLEQTLNFTRAAALRHATQPAYSRRIQRLEEWLGVPLFNRDSRPIQLTPEGKEFLPRARRLREDMLDARRALKSMASHYQKGFRIYTTNTLAIGFLPSWLKQEKIKNYSLVVASQRGCVEALRQGKADSVFIPDLNSDDYDGLGISKIVGQDRLVLMAHKDIVDQIICSEGRLEGPVMHYTPGTAYGFVIQEMLRQSGVFLSQRPVCESASAEALVAQAKASLGAAWVPESLIEGGLLEACAVPESLCCSYQIIMLSR